MKPSAGQSITVTQPTHPRDERPVDRLATDVSTDEHNLSQCAATFCDGNLARYLGLYDVVVRAESELPNKNMPEVRAWQGWFAGIFQSLRQAVQH